MTEEEIKEYINRKDELLLKLSDKDKDTLEWILFGYNECARLLDEKIKENQKLKSQYCERTDCSGRIGNSKKVEQLQTENQQLKQQLEQRDNIMNKAREYVDKFIPIDEDTILMRIRQKNYLLEILNIDKGE